jgi:hypothetical protein
MRFAELGIKVPEGVVLRAKTGAVRWVLTAFGGGAGAALGYTAIQAIKAHPELLQQLLSSGAFGFAALIIGMVIFRQQFENFNVTQQRGVFAQEQLAISISELVSRDDQRAREQELTLNHLARGTDEILRRLDDLACLQKKQCDLK